MKNVIFLFLLLASNFSYGQLSAVDYYNEDFTRFRASKTYVVTTGNEVFDTQIAAAMKESWKITSFDFVDGKILDTKISDKSASFIVLVTIAGGSGSQAYHYLALINGGRKKLNSYSYGDLLAYAPVNHFGGEYENIDCGYRVRNMLESMVQAMDLVQKNDFKGNSLKLSLELKKVYLQKSPEIKKRTLLVCEELIGGGYGGKKPKVFSKAEFASKYPFKFEYVSKERLAQIINERSTDYYYLQFCSTLNKSIFVFDPSNGEVLYFAFKIMGGKLVDTDVEELTNAIRK